jgi:hypothetical protein
MIKKNPIKTPYFFDTPKGVDHVTKTVVENSSKKLTPIEIADMNKLNRDTKLSLLKSEEQSLKKFMNEDPSTYPSDPVQRGKLLNIEKLEKSLGIRSDSWKRLVKTGAIPIGKKEPDLWKDVIYKSMTPQEKGTWNAEQRKKGYNGKTGDKLYTPAQDALKNVIKGETKTKIEIKPEISIPLPIIRKQPELPFDPPLPKFERKNMSGIHEGFVREKLREGEILKQIEKEIKNEV